MSDFRGTSQALKAQITSLHQKYYELLTISVYDPEESGTTGVSNVTVRICNAPFDITIASGPATGTYTGLSGYLGFGDVDETSDFAVSSVAVSLSGIPRENAKLFLRANYTDRPIEIYRVWLDTSNQQIGQPLIVFDGRIDKPVINDDGKQVTIAANASSHWVDYDRKNGRKTNDNVQQYWFSGDRGFEYVTENVKELKWGSK